MADFRAIRLSSRIAPVVLVAVIGSASGPVHPASGATQARPSWSAPNIDPANTRATGGPISSANVRGLGVAWEAPLRADNAFYGGMSGTPVVVRGTVYLQDMRSNVEARSVRTGRLFWRRTYDDASVGPNGVSVVDGTVYGATESFAFALDARTGQERWRSRRLPRNGQEGVDMAPGVFDGTLYVSTTPGNFTSFYRGYAAGVLWALDARTGKRRWTFRTVPFSLWGNPRVNSGGGLWNPPAFDGRGGVYINVANPGPTNAGGPGNVWARSRPGPNLYTNSVVKLDARTGRVRWHYQVIPHDLYDWDSQLPPIYDARTDRVYISGKYGRVLAFDARTGHRLWETYVGDHNGHDDDNLLALRGRYSLLPTFPFVVTPGEAGGVETPMAFVGRTVYAPIVNVPYTMTTPGTSTANFVAGTGALAAIDARTGRKRWERRLPSALFGAATVVNDLLFSTDYGGRVLAFRRSTGALVWEYQMSAGTNAQLSVVGDTLITAASAPQDGETPKIVAFRLGAHGTPPGKVDSQSPDPDAGTITGHGGLAIGEPK